MFRRLKNTFFSVGLLAVFAFGAGMNPWARNDELFTNPEEDFERLNSGNLEDNKTVNKNSIIVPEFIGPPEYVPLEVKLYSEAPAPIDFNSDPFLIATAVRLSRNSAYIIADITEPGTVYVAMYDVDPGIRTAAQIRDDANNVSPHADRIRGGNFTFSGASDPDSPPYPGTPYGFIRFASLSTSTQYWTKMVAYNSDGTISSEGQPVGIIEHNGNTSKISCSVGAPGSGQLGSNTLKCGPRDVEFNTTFQGLAYSDPYRIFVEYFFDFETEGGYITINQNIAIGLQNPTQLDPSLQVWEATGTHTFPDDGADCGYEARALLHHAELGTACLGFPQQQIFEVFDDIANTDLGQIQISHAQSPNPAFEVCESERENGIVFTDISQFNCQPDIEDNQINSLGRWIQLIYGTNAADADFLSDVEVDASSEGNGTITLFPYSGDIVYYAAGTEEPNPETASLPIDVLETNVFLPFGKRFVVELKNWNYCNQYDEFILDDPYSPVGGDLVNGDNLPITLEDSIVLVQQPAIPISAAKSNCFGSNPPTFDITFPAAYSDVQWYEDNGAGTAPAAFIRSTGLTKSLNASDYEPGGGLDNTSASGNYYVWARYLGPSGSQTCISPSVRVDLAIWEELTPPASVSSSEGASGFAICADGPNITFTVDDGPPGVGTPGGAWEYDWLFGGGLGDNLNWVTGDGGQSRTLEITSNAASGARRVRVRKRYVTQADRIYCNCDC